MASSSSSSSKKYHVFLSFRGDDTRKGFVSHLCLALKNKGIDTFKDDRRLEKGSTISPALLDAIKNSSFSIVVISANYATSSWCLEELHNIIQRKEQGFMTVLPIFYDVDPSDVKSQRKSFGKAFKKHEKKYRADDPEKLQRWRKALTDVAQITGWDSRNWEEEAEMIIHIVSNISTSLFPSSSDNDIKKFVGMEARLKEIAPLLCMESADEVRIIGIWGMGGVGKTTIAGCLYNKHSAQYQASCFIDVTQKNGKRNLAEYFLSEILKERDFTLPNPQLGSEAIQKRLGHKNVFVVLDNVDNLDQLVELVSIDWFGGGSRIVITTRDKHLLDAHGVLHVYPVECLMEDESLQLFCRHAFNKEQPESNFKDLTGSAIQCTGRLPLALKVLGAFLKRRSREEWESALQKLRQVADKDVMNVLKVSYDSLDEECKSIFLLVAGSDDCLIADSVDDWERVIEACNYSTIGIKVLAERALLEIRSKERIWMHDLLQQMGEDILQKQRDYEPEKCQFLFNNSDICHVLKNNTGTRAVKGIQNYMSAWEELPAVAYEALRNMSSLKFFITIADPFKNQEPQNQSTKVLTYLHSLGLLYWECYPSQALPSGFRPQNLVELSMPFSRNLEKLWEGIQPLRRLKKINLSFCRKLKELPDLSRAVNLEELDLSNCESLARLPEIGNLEKLEEGVQPLKRLKKINLFNCEKLKELPDLSRAINLEELDLSHCKSLIRLPEIGNLEKLGEGTQSLGRLKKINLSGCEKLEELPDLSRVVNLEELNLSHCQSLTRLPKIGSRKLKSLELRNLGWARLQDLQRTIADLFGIEYLDIGGLGITEFPIVPSTIKKLRLKGNRIEQVPSWIEKLSQLQILDLSDNQCLKSIPGGIFKLESLCELDLWGCKNLESFSLETPKAIDCSEELPEIPPLISNLSHLCILTMNGCKKLRNLPSIIYNLTALEKLDMMGCKMLEDFQDAIENLKSLRSLEVSDSQQITQFPRVPGNIQELVIQNTALEEVPPWIEKLSQLRVLDLSYNKCLKVVSIGIFQLNSLLELHLSELPNLESFSRRTPKTGDGPPKLEEESPLITNLPCLRKLILQGCKMLRKLPIAFENLTALEELVLSCSEMLEDFPDTFENLKSLKSLYISGIPRITKIPFVPNNINELAMVGTAIEEVPCWIEKLHRLRILVISSSRILKNIPSGIFKMTSFWMLRLQGCRELQDSDCEELSSLQNLRRLFDQVVIRETMMEEIPSGIENLSGIISIDLAYNERLKSISANIFELTSLKRLNLSHCQSLESLPQEIPEISQLQYLDLSSNKSLKSIPNNIFKLTRLEWLDLSNCQSLHGVLEEVPNIWLNLQSNRMLKSIQLINEGMDSPRSSKEVGGSFVILPGNQVPGALNNKDAECFLTINLPRGRTAFEFVGFVACLVISIDDQPGAPSFGAVKVKLSGKSFAKGMWRFPRDEQFYLESDHLILLNHVFPTWKAHNNIYMDDSLAELSHGSDYEDIDTTVVHDEISFEFSLRENTRKPLKVKECGVHLFFKEDIEKCGADGVTITSFSPLDSDCATSKEEARAAEFDSDNQQLKRRRTA